MPLFDFNYVHNTNDEQLAAANSLRLAGGGHWATHRTVEAPCAGYGNPPAWLAATPAAKSQRQCRLIAGVVGASTRLARCPTPAGPPELTGAAQSPRRLEGLPVADQARSSAVSPAPRHAPRTC